MSDFAFFRFKSNNMLTADEEQHKEEILKITEEVLEAKGIECDARIAKISEEQLREVLEEVRKLRKKRKKASQHEEDSEDQAEKPVEEEPSYVK